MGVPESYKELAANLEDLYEELESLRASSATLTSREAELRKDRDAWKARAGFLSIEGVPDSVSECYFDSDEECAKAIDDEMRKTADHWGLLPHIEAIDAAISTTDEAKEPVRERCGQCPELTTKVDADHNPQCSRHGGR